MFTKILVANRGEIARRIFRAARELGVATVAIYSDADADAPWVRDADESVALGGVTATDSYLNQAKVLAAAHATGAEAIHPGYGFLSENAAFAEAVADAGLTFIGPSPHAMREMGSKARARDIARAAGVPVTPGVDGAGKSDATLLDSAESLTYPILIKASAGGGGKGMRIVHAPDDFLDALQAARREAQSAFGDDHILLERYFTEIHHIEVQVLGDEHGNVVHLFERECSIQRRHQKIIEETPSPNLTEETRAQMTAAAVALARAVGYSSAGTVEFMLIPDGSFFLLEMNTRLQVEHPITERVTGIDLAAWQIRIAAGEPLSFTQADLTQRGHAIECRLYAEDPANGFLPSTGTITTYQPPNGPGVRVDDGIESGSVVSPYYDPMLAKVITGGHNRAEAIRKMIAALRQTVILGVTSNVPYLLAILQEERFQQGHTPTRYLDDRFAGWQPTVPVDDDFWLAAAVAEALHGGEKSRLAVAESAGAALPDPWNNRDGWRNV